MLLQGLGDSIHEDDKPDHANGTKDPEPTAGHEASARDRKTGVRNRVRASKVVDNPLAKALRARKVAPMRLWGKENNDRVQACIQATGGKKIGAWSRCAAHIWHSELSDEERSEYRTKAEELSVPDDEQCYMYVDISNTCWMGRSSHSTATKSV